MDHQHHPFIHSITSFSQSLSFEMTLHSTTTALADLGVRTPWADKGYDVFIRLPGDKFVKTCHYLNSPTGLLQSSIQQQCFHSCSAANFFSPQNHLSVNRS